MEDYQIKILKENKNGTIDLEFTAQGRIYRLYGCHISSFGDRKLQLGYQSYQELCEACEIRKTNQEEN